MDFWRLTSRNDWQRSPCRDSHSKGSRHGLPSLPCPYIRIPLLHYVSFLLYTAMLSLLVLSLRPTFCEASPISLAYRHSWLMAIESLWPKKDYMLRAERERTAVCATSCRSQGFKDLCPLPAVHLSWCSTWRYCGRFTAHPWLLYHSFPFLIQKSPFIYWWKCLSTKVSCRWHTSLLLAIYPCGSRQGQNMLVWRQASSWMSMLHSHLSYLLYTVRQYSFIIRLCPTPLRSVTGSVVIQTPLADVNKLILANDDSMPKYQHEKITCPCHKPSRLTLRWLASRTFNILVLCRYSRPETASLPTHSFLVLRSTFIIYMIFSLVLIT